MNKILIVVDYQVDFVTGSLGFPRSAELEDAICRQIETFKENGDTVAFTLDTHFDNYLDTREGRGLPVTHCVRGTEGWQLYGKVAEYMDASTPVFEKYAFGSMALAKYLESHPFDEIYLVGVAAEICVFSNAILAASARPEAKVCVISDCTASPRDGGKEEALKTLADLQIEIL